MSRHARYFDNKYQNNPDAGSAKVSKVVFIRDHINGYLHSMNGMQSLEASQAIKAQVTEEFIRSEAARIVNSLIGRDRSADDFEGGAYVGSAGEGYAVHYASSLFPNYADTQSSFCIQIVDKQLSYVKNDRKSETQYLLGTLSVYMIKILCEYEWRGVKNQYLIDKIGSMSETICSKDYLPRGADEMLVGRAGYVAAILNLRMRVKDEVISNDRLKFILDRIIDSGRQYSRRYRCKAPLMYQYYNTEYLGAAHGLMGILQMLVTFSHLLDEEAVRDIEDTLDWILGIQEENGNFAPDVDEIGRSRGENELVHWCHGAPGAVHLMIAAYVRFTKDKFLKAAEKSLDLVWKKGVLRKGPGICHGVAGNGYAFLLYYRLTRNEKYLKYAQCFARIMCEDDFKKHARTPDSPYSLFEGVGGALCFLVDLIKPTKAQFPLIPINF